MPFQRFKTPSLFRIIVAAALVCSSITSLAENYGYGKLWLIAADERFGLLLWSVSKVKGANPRAIPQYDCPGNVLDVLDVAAILYNGNNGRYIKPVEGMPSYNLAVTSPMQYTIQSLEAFGASMKTGWHAEIGLELPVTRIDVTHLSALLVSDQTNILVVRAGNGDCKKVLHTLTREILSRMIKTRLLTASTGRPEFLEKDDDDNKTIAKIWKDTILPAIFTHPKQVTVYSKLGVIAVVLDDNDVNLNGQFESLLHSIW